MELSSTLFIWILFAPLGAILAGLFLISRQLKSQSKEAQEVSQLAASMQVANERLERELRNAIHESAAGKVGVRRRI